MLFMRKRYGVVIVVLIVLALADGAIALYVRGISPRFVLWQAARTLQAAPYIEADIKTKLFIGPLRPSATVHVKHGGKGFDVIDAGEVALYSQPAPGCVVFPHARTAVLLEGEDAGKAFDQALNHWGGGKVAQWLEEAASSGAVSLRPPETTRGGPCWVLEYRMPGGAAKSEGPEGLGFLSITPDWKEIADRIATVRLLVNRSTKLPVKALFLDAQGQPVMINTISKAKLGPRPPAAEFTYTVPQGYTVVHRKLDPKAPWKTFLPPGDANGSSTNFLEKKLMDYLRKR